MGNRYFEMSGGFVLLTALLLFVDRQGIMPWFFAAAALHEAGHWLAIRLAGGRVRRLRLTAVGAVMELGCGVRMSYGGELAAALAGPGANLLAALLISRMAAEENGLAYLFAGINLVLAAFNLLPVRCLDGGRALFLLLSRFWLPERAEALCRVVSAGTTVLICGAGTAVLLYTGRNFTLLAAGIWLALAGRERGLCLGKRRLSKRPGRYKI